jgi:hypothetical protein
MIRARVGIDDYLGPYPALVSDHRWNGWAMPYFTRTTARAIVQDINAARERGQIEMRATWRGDSVVIIDEDGTTEEYAPVWVAGHPRYPIGAGGWVWSESD